MDFFKEASNILVNGGVFNNIAHQQTKIDHVDHHSQNPTINYIQNYWDTADLASKAGNAFILMASDVGTHLKDERIGHVVNALAGLDPGKMLYEQAFGIGTRVNEMACNGSQVLKDETFKVSNALTGAALDLSNLLNDKRISDLLDGIGFAAKTMLNGKHLPVEALGEALGNMFALSSEKWSEGNWKEAEDLVQKALDMGETVLDKTDPLIQLIANLLVKMHAIVLDKLNEVKIQV